MKTKEVLAIGIIALLACSVGLVIAQEQSKEYVVINAQLSPEEGENIYHIPSGSIVYHFADGITTVYTPNGECILKARNFDAAMIPTPKGPKPATFVFQVPSGSFISTKERTEFYAQDKQCVVAGNTTKVYLNGTLILTVIDEEGSIAGETYDWGGWVEWAQDLYVSNLGDFRAYWHVPSSPPSPHSDVCDYLFNGIEPFWGGEIIQPVLEYFESCHCWKGAAWYADGNSFHSDPIDCYVGDYIQGWMLWTGSPPDWSVDFYDITRGTSTVLNTDAIDPSTVRAYVTYEGHNLVNDNDAPGDTTFERMVFRDTSGNSVNIDWSGHVEGSAPLTGLNVEIISQSEVILHTAN